MKQLTSPLLMTLLCGVAAPLGAQAATGVIGILMKGGSSPATASNQVPQEMPLTAPVIILQPPLFLAPPQLGGPLHHDTRFRCGGNAGSAGYRGRQPWFEVVLVGGAH